MQTDKKKMSKLVKKKYLFIFLQYASQENMAANVNFPATVKITKSAVSMEYVQKTAVQPATSTMMNSSVTLVH